MTLQDLANNWSDAMCQKERGDTTIVVCKDDAPQELKDAIFEAHESMLPDDWRYRMCWEALLILAEHEEDTYSEGIDGMVPIYTHTLMDWLGSRADRYCYVDGGREELGGGGSIINEIQVGYYQELSEVLYSMRSSLETALEELEDEESESED